MARHSNKLHSRSSKELSHRHRSLAKMMTYHSNYMIFNLNNDKDRADYKDYCNGLYMDALKSGKGFIVEVKKKHRPRSLAQNSYLHVCLQYFASEFGYDEEYVKYNIFKQIVNREIFAKQRTNRRGQPVTYWRSTADLDTKELTDAIEKFRNYSSMVAGLYIPEPNEEAALLEAQKQIALYEKYL